MDRQQFIHHVECNQRTVRRFLTALCCGDTALADDLAQDTFVKAYLSCGDFKDGSKFTAWIFRIAYNTFISRRRTCRPFEPIAEADGVVGGGEADSAFEYQDLYLALGRISEKERTAILLFYMQGYSVKEIAEITQSTPDSVRQLLSRGRVHLKGFLKM